MAPKVTIQSKDMNFFILSAKRNELSIPKEYLLEPILPSEAIVAALVWFLLVSTFSSKWKRINNFHLVTLESNNFLAKCVMPPNLYEPVLSLISKPTQDDCKCGGREYLHISLGHCSMQ